MISRIIFLISKNFSDIKTKFQKGKCNLKREIFLIRIDFPFPKDKKRFFAFSFIDEDLKNCKTMLSITSNFNY
jgi:hypothetical protein